MRHYIPLFQPLIHTFPHLHSPRPQQLQINYHNKMQINLSALSFKISKPLSASSPQGHSCPQIAYKQCLGLGFEDTQASCTEQQASNPFRRTFHLFKHVYRPRGSSERSLSPPDAASPQPHPACGQPTPSYTLDNFDSFNNFESRPEPTHSEANTRSAKPHYGTHSTENHRIRAQPLVNQSFQFTRLANGLNSVPGGPTQIPNPHRRIRTECDQEDTKEAKQKSSFFCLTAQEESQSTVKQFYFDLRQEQKKVKDQQKELGSSLKGQIKTVVQNFVTDLQFADQEQVDPEFILRLRNCLATLRRISPGSKGAASQWAKRIKYPPSQKACLAKGGMDKQNKLCQKSKEAAGRGKREHPKQKWVL